MSGPCWKVGELAARTGLTVRTLHHYDAIGLLSPSGRTGSAHNSGHRLYTAADLARLPQTCLRTDRRSVMDQWGLEHDDAMAHELRLGREALAAPDLAVTRFVEGAGRHGSPA